MEGGHKSARKCNILFEWSLAVKKILLYEEGPKGTGGG